MRTPAWVHLGLKKPHWVGSAVRAGSRRRQRGLDAPSWFTSRPGNQHPPAPDLAVWGGWQRCSPLGREPDEHQADGANIRSYHRAVMTFMSWQIRRGVLAAPGADRPGSSMRILMALSALPQPRPELADLRALTSTADPSSGAPSRRSVRPARPAHPGAVTRRGDGQPVARTRQQLPPSRSTRSSPSAGRGTATDSVTTIPAPASLTCTPRKTAAQRHCSPLRDQKTGRAGGRSR